ncbi:hypothetical protein T07_13349 [Trichinella nelsoni]|uniref:Uncharacterized protein n=1 Tax=Trichinella nelsoni TaxID=6336 RepID=A0A0V0S6S6_9BILA|nr:hypothetical protein T07_13349 [Trichinella nelsoni]
MRHQGIHRGSMKRQGEPYGVDDRKSLAIPVLELTSLSKLLLLRSSIFMLHHPNQENNTHCEMVRR